MNRRVVKIIFLAAICVILFLVPFFFSVGYSVGGDDSRLYYLFPKEYLQNYLFQVMNGNGLGDSIGYMAVSSIAPLVFLIYLFKVIVPFVNVQQAFYGMNMALGFLFCYLFFRSRDRKQSNLLDIGAAVASGIYITSPYLVKSLYQSELSVVYLVGLIPYFFYTFVKSIEEKNIGYTVLSALGVFFLSSAPLSLAWFLPVMIVTLPYIFWMHFRNVRSFWKSCTVFIFLSIGLHWHWLVHGIIALLSSHLDKTLVGVIASGEFIKESGNTMYASMFLNSPMHQIAGYMRTSWEDHQPMASVMLIGMIPLFLVSLAGARLSMVKKPRYDYFAIVVFSLVFCLIFITPNMGAWNMDGFLFLNKTIPLFSMFRNMNNKFALAMAFVSAWAVFTSFSVFMKEKRWFWRIVPLCLGIALLLFQIPQFFDIQGVGRTKFNFTQISPEYSKLVRFISAMDTTKKFVWYPMTFPGYPPIQDVLRPDVWYLGLSPLQVLGGKQDISGFYSIQTSFDPTRNWKILELLKEKKYDDVVSILASYNVGYVITLNTPLPDSILKKLDLFSFMTLQNQEYRQALLGEKLFDSGLYSLYTIHPTYRFGSIFLTNDSENIRAPKQAVPYRLIGTNTYDVTLPSSMDFRTLVLLSPYHGLWSATVQGKNANFVSIDHHRPSYSFGNAWDITRRNVSIDPIVVRIVFLPDRIVLPSLGVSVFVCIGCIVYVLWRLKRSRT